MTQGYKTFQALLGIFHNLDRRYVEYVDGSIMADGFFNDVKGQFFSDIYSTNQNVSTSFMIASDGNIFKGSTALILCEKSLIKDLSMCIQSSNLQTNIAVNTSTSINILNRNSAALCIEYCRGWSNQSYAVLNYKVCSCASSISFKANMPENTIGVNVTNVLMQLLLAKSAKTQSKNQCLFALLGFAHVKLH